MRFIVVQHINEYAVVYQVTPHIRIRRIRRQREGVVASLDPSKCSVTYLDDVIWTVGTAAARSVTGLLNVTTTGCATPTTRRLGLSLNPWMGPVI